MNYVSLRKCRARPFGLGLVVLFAVAVAVSACATQRPAPVTGSQKLAAPAFERSVVELKLGELAAALSPAQVNAALGDALRDDSDERRRAAAVLMATGAIAADDLQPERSTATAAKLRQFVDITNSGHPALMGRVGDVGLLPRLNQPLHYNQLLSATEEIAALGEALSAGVITGYDLRATGVYDNFPSGETFIYSHSDLLHLRQLVALMQREDLKAWVYVTPKISAFLYREEWGGSGDNLVTLANGVRVVQGREMAVLFRFDQAADRLRFRDLVTRYAKRDSDDETGLIASAWWQPFYYSDQAVADFEPISLIVLNNAHVEATLTVVEGKAAGVVEAVQEGPWTLRKDKVWVNPAFHRFLQGGFK